MCTQHMLLRVERTQCTVPDGCGLVQLQPTWICSCMQACRLEKEGYVTPCTCCQDCRALEHAFMGDCQQEASRAGQGSTSTSAFRASQTDNQLSVHRQPRGCQVPVTSMYASYCLGCSRQALDTSCACPVSTRQHEILFCTGDSTIPVLCTRCRSICNSACHATGCTCLPCSPHPWLTGGGAAGTTRRQPH